jgi:DNA-binding CsgD family transcriptional regulator
VSFILPGSPHEQSVPPRVRTKVRTLKHWIEREEDHEPVIHQTLIRELASLVRAEASTSFCPTFVPDVGWSSDYIHAMDFERGRVVDDEVLTALAAAPADSFSPIFPLTKANRDRVLYGSFETQRKYAEYHYRKIEEAVFVPMATVGMALTDEGVFVGWIGFGSYQDAFAPWTRTLLDDLQSVLRRRLRFDRRIRELRAAGAGIDLALEALEVPAFILVGGRMLHANAAGRSAFDGNRAGVLAALSESLKGAPDAPFAISERSLAGLPTIALAIQRRPAEPRSLDELARTCALTPRERAVLQLLVRGLSNKVIAGTLSCAVKTVEVHVSAILRKTRAGSRAELTARLWRTR